MGAQGSCCSCEDERSSNYTEDGNRLGREARKRLPNEFTIVVDRRNGEGLGIDATPEKGTLTIKRVTPGGLVDRWNCALREGHAERVAPDMRVVEVNGRYNSAMQLIAACRENEVLSITVAPKHDASS